MTNTHLPSTLSPDPGVVPIPMPAPVTTSNGWVPVGDGHHLWFQDSGGEGEPMVFLHAASGSGKMWGYQVPFFTAAGYRVITYSRRGYEGSIVGDVEQPGIGAQDLLQLVDYLDLPHFHLASTAAGGAIATDFAVSFHKRLLSLVLSNTIIGFQDTEWQKIYQAIWPEEFFKLPTDFRELGPSYRHRDPEGTRSWKAMHASSRTAPLPPQALLNHVTFACVQNWTMPVLISTGDADLYTPPSMARTAANHIPGATFQLIPDSGHTSFWERPDLWNRMVLEFTTASRLNRSDRHGRQ